MSITKKILLFIIVLVFLGGMLIATRQMVNAIPINKGADNQWPAFEMIYKVEIMGEGGTFYSQMVKLVYENELHWKTELLSHDLAPEMVGYVSEYTGKEMITYDPNAGSSSTSTDVPTDGIYVPDQWLNPNYIPGLLGQEGVIVQPGQTEGVYVLTLTEYSPCPEETSAVPCKTGSTRVLETKIEYRSSDFIPFSIIDIVDGTVVRRITITELIVQE
ncbi:MAG: hypothetical protein Fur0022_32640 [Anaerolineales bacterium]